MLQTLLNYTGALVGGGAIAWLALAVFAPGVLNVLSSWLVAMAPLVGGISEGIVSIAKRLWDGLLDVADNINTILFVLVVAAGVAFYAHSSQTTCSCKKCVDDLRKEYKFVPKSPKAPDDSSWWSIERIWK